MIKNILAVLGGVFVVLIVATLCAYLQWGSVQRGAENYAAESTAIIFQDWTFDELKNRAAPMMFKGTNEEGVHKVFTSLSTLGKMKSLDGCQGQVSLNLGNGQQPPVTGQYACKVTFEKDVAVVKLFIIGDYFNHWKIGAMQVSSDFLAKNANVTK